MTSAAQDRCRCNPTESNGGSSTWCERCEKPKGFAAGPPLASSAAQKHECQRCGSDEWEYVDYGGCSVCRSHEDRQREDEEDSVARWVGWARTTSLRHGLTTFGGAA